MKALDKTISDIYSLLEEGVKPSLGKTVEVHINFEATNQNDIHNNWKVFFLDTQGERQNISVENAILTDCRYMIDKSIANRNIRDNTSESSIKVFGKLQKYDLDNKTLLENLVGMEGVLYNPFIFPEMIRYQGNMEIYQQKDFLNKRTRKDAHYALTQRINNGLISRPFNSDKFKKQLQNKSVGYSEKVVLGNFPEESSDLFMKNPRLFGGIEVDKIVRQYEGQPLKFIKDLKR